VKDGNDTCDGFDSITLVGLDDSGVAKDHTQVAEFGVRSSLHSALAAGTVAPRKLPPSSPLDAIANVDTDVDFDIDWAPSIVAVPPAPGRAPAARTLTEALVALESAESREVATDIAMEFAARRWRSAALFTIDAGTALGHRGHGTVPPAVAVQSMAFPLAGRSIIRAAHDVPDLVARVPDDTGPIEERIERLLGSPATPMAVAISAGTEVAGILVVGDPTGNAADAPVDLEHLGLGLGDAYARALGDRNRR